jgi:hypothetical protein
MTKGVMKTLGFREAACDIAARANARVDDKQGNGAQETNLHAMRGLAAKSLTSFSPTLVLQSEEDTREAVAKIISEGRNDVVQSVLKGDYEQALKRMGEVLHTVQDRAFHNFEPWPYAGIADAIMKDPSYMICHAIRDLSWVSDIVVGPKRTEIELSYRVAGDIYVGVRGFHNGQGPSPYLPPTMHGPEWNNSFQGTGALVSITFGAAPGSLPPPGSSIGNAATPDDRQFWQTTTRGVGMRTRAEDDSGEFIKSIERVVKGQPNGANSWTAFLSWDGSRRSAVSP